MNRVVAGAVGGLLATVPMTLAMTRLFNQLPSSEQYPLPPREITETVARRAKGGERLDDRQTARLSLAAHFAYGAVTGALYPLLFRRSRNAILYGSGYGVAIWAASYLGWIPAAKILRPATQHPARRNALMLAAHCVWGAKTAMITQALTGSSGAFSKERKFSRARPGRQSRPDDVHAVDYRYPEPSTTKHIRE